MSIEYGQLNVYLTVSDTYLLVPKDNER
jgi:hypothetical protein